jgi:serine protease Do
MKFPLPLLFAVTLCAATGAMAETVKDREGAVHKDKAAMENDARWAYNDLDRAFAEGKRTGKPVLVVLRCVPCLSCAGIDASVLTEPELTPLLDQFVCARVINANALELSLFQFDYDLSFSAIVFNADKTIYGRFGSWTHQKNQHEKSTVGFRRSLERALELHKGYPANKAALAGKQSPPSPYQTPVNIPTLDGKYRLELDWQGKVVPSCVHCHQIGDALRTVHRNKREPLPESLIYPMPAPETIGLTLAQDSVGKVESVAADSIASRAGLRVGDDIVSAAGQLIISVADLAWVLHRTSSSGSVPIVAKRGLESVNVSLELPAGWRMKSDISRRVGTWGMRAMATGGLQLEELPDAERSAKALAADSMALRVKHVGEYGKHAAAKRAGFQKEDVLVAVGSWNKRMSEGELIGRLLLAHPAGTAVNATVLRGGQRLELKLPMQ